MRNILIACYSFSGSTQLLAEQIAEQTGGLSRAIVPERPYSFDYNTASKEARSQIERGHCPKLLSGNEPIADFDAIFVGSPNWFRSVAPPVLAFLRSHDFAGKTVIPFCTHGGGGFGQIEDIIRSECAGATLLSGLSAPGGASSDEVGAWLGRIGMLGSGSTA